MKRIDGSIKDYYAVLGLPSESTQNEIQKAYYSLNKSLHPDIRSTNANNMDEKTALSKLKYVAI